MKVNTSDEAMAIISRIAYENPRYVSKDLDALIEVGEADMETIFCGYLWDAVEDEVPEMDEDTNTLMSDAIIDFYCEQLAECFSLDEEDEY